MAQKYNPVFLPGSMYHQFHMSFYNADVQKFFLLAGNFWTFDARIILYLKSLPAFLKVR